MSANRITVREFARRDGCDERLVRRAIKRGRLTRGSDGKLDAALVATAWRAGNKLPSDASADTGLEKRFLSARRLAELRALSAVGIADSDDSRAARATLVLLSQAVRDAWHIRSIELTGLVAAELGVPLDWVAETLATRVRERLQGLSDREVLPLFGLSAEQLRALVGAQPDRQPQSVTRRT